MSTNNGHVTLCMYNSARIWAEVMELLRSQLCLRLGLAAEQVRITVAVDGEGQPVPTLLLPEGQPDSESIAQQFLANAAAEMKIRLAGLHQYRGSHGQSSQEGSRSPRQSA